MLNHSTWNWTAKRRLLEYHNRKPESCSAPTSRPVIAGSRAEAVGYALLEIWEGLCLGCCRCVQTSGPHPLGDPIAPDKAMKHGRKHVQRDQGAYRQPTIIVHTLGDSRDSFGFGYQRGHTPGV